MASAVQTRARVSSRLLEISREMEAERQTVGSAEDLQRDAEDHLNCFRKSRERANSIVEREAADNAF
jgi:hypothetical protein